MLCGMVILLGYDDATSKVVPMRTVISPLELASSITRPVYSDGTTSDWNSSSRIYLHGVSLTAIASQASQCTRSSIQAAWHPNLHLLKLAR